jgi:glycerophosphoryl diester phosphodiesterase
MKPLVIAHRGNSAHRPENTLASFASALEIGATWLELDVQLTKDGQVIVLHDATLDRTTSGSGPAAALTLQQVRALSAGYPSRFGEAFSGERVPLLSEALAMARGRAKVLVEIKHDSVTDDERADGIEARTLQEIRKAGASDEVAILSFDHRALVRCARMAPEIARGHLFYRAGIAEAVAATLAVGAEIVMPEKGMLNEEMRQRAIEAGLKLATWVVDDPADLPGLAALGVYGFGTNRPGEMLEALDDLPD